MTAIDFTILSCLRKPINFLSLCAHQYARGPGLDCDRWFWRRATPCGCPDHHDQIGYKVRGRHGGLPYASLLPRLPESCGFRPQSRGYCGKFQHIDNDASGSYQVIIDTAQQLAPLLISSSHPFPLKSCRSRYHCGQWSSGVVANRQAFFGNISKTPTTGRYRHDGSRHRQSNDSLR